MTSGSGGIRSTVDDRGMSEPAGRPLPERPGLAAWRASARSISAVRRWRGSGISGPSPRPLRSIPRRPMGDRWPGRSRSGLALALGLSQPGALALAADRGALAAIGLTLVHAFYWTDLRMRAPIVPAIALVAAGADCSAYADPRDREPSRNRPVTDDARRLTDRRLSSGRWRRARTRADATKTSQRAIEKLMPVAATIPTTAAASRWRSKNSTRDGKDTAGPRSSGRSPARC